MTTTRVPRPGEPLTAREVEIVQRVAEDLSNLDVARRLGLSEHTVKTHLRRISIKLCAEGRRDVVRRAEAAGLVLVPRPPSPAEVRRAQAAEAAFAALEQLVAGKPWPAVRRDALEALTAAGRRGPGGRPLVPAQDRRVAS